MAAVRNEQKRQSIIPLVNFLFLGAVFACVLFPGFDQYRAVVKGKKDLAVCRANIAKLAEIVEDYRSTHRGEVPDSLVYFTKRGPDHVLDDLPRCPAYEGEDVAMVYSMGYSRVQATRTKRAEFTISCHGDNHAILELGQGEPYYSSVHGMHPTDAEVDQINSSHKVVKRGEPKKVQQDKKTKDGEGKKSNGRGDSPKRK